jgi:hypothetical protein
VHQRLVAPHRRGAGTQPAELVLDRRTRDATPLAEGYNLPLAILKGLGEMRHQTIKRRLCPWEQT